MNNQLATHEKYQELVKLYPQMHSWLSNITKGERPLKSRYNYYDKNLWKPLKDIITYIKSKEQKSKLDEVFLECCYVGKIYRVLNYNPRKKAYIYASGNYQSWSKLEGIQEVIGKGYSCESIQHLIVCGNVKEDDFAVDIFEVISFIFTFFPNEVYEYSEKRSFEEGLEENKFKPENLERYIKEYEIVASIREDIIEDVVIVRGKFVNNDEIAGESVPRTKWFRKSF